MLNTIATEQQFAGSGALIVKFKSPVPDFEVCNVFSETCTSTLLDTNIYSVRISAGRENKYARRLVAHFNIDYIQADHRVSAQVLPSDPYYTEQWGLAKIQLPQAWESITDTSRLVIAVLDTGAKVTHPDLEGQFWTNTQEVPANGIDDDGNGFVDDVHGAHFFHTYSNGQALARQDSSINDTNGHGTHISGIIGAVGNNGIGVSGVTWRAQIMAVKVLESDGFGWESDVIRGMWYALDHGADIINISIGQAQSSPALAEVIAAAEAQGVLIVAAAGNGGDILYPAAFPTVLSVGASSPSNQRASFSAIGTRLDLIAPGVDILSTWNGVPYFTKSGTSMAAPHVTGVSALLLTTFPSLSPQELRECLMRTATDLELPGRDNETGWGLVNAGRAIQGCPQLLFLPLATTTKEKDRATKPL